LNIDPETAMSEVRPWMGSFVSLANFDILRDLRLIDCAYDAEIVRTIPEQEHSVWTELNIAFSEPADRNDDVADYAPTQILAEIFREAGYDGIMYASRLGDRGMNLALFDLSVAKFLSSTVYRVEKLHYKFTPVPEVKPTVPQSPPPPAHPTA